MATVAIPRSRQVRNTRDAISARLATSRRWITGRNTPNRSVPAYGLFSITDRQMPRIVRVSRGSITPSS